MKRADPLFKLRLPEYRRKKLEEQANKKKQSLTSEILNRLEESFSNDSDKMLELVERITALEKAVFYTKEHPVTKYRKQNGWTQEELAEKLGVSQNYISNIELKLKRPKKLEILLLCDLFSVNYDDLIKELDEYK